MSNLTSTRASAAAGPQSRALSRSSTVDAFIEFARNLDLIQAVSLLTLVLTIIFGFEHWVFRIISRMCFLLFVLHPRSLRRPQFWLVLAVAGTFSTIATWERADNHKYLLDYWLWILFVVHLFPHLEQQRRVILLNARFFLCLIFLAAAGQKISSPSYRSGEMFEYYLYADGRFAAFGKLIGVDRSVVDGVKRRGMFLRSPYADVEGNDIHVTGSDRARVAAVVMTWWDFSLQLLIGVLLLFRQKRTDVIAHVLLLFFIFTTYLPAPVFGFGWILAIMGFTLAKEKFPRITAAYVICFFTILLYQLPWREWVLGMDT